MTKTQYSDAVYNLLHKMKMGEPIVIIDLLNFGRHTYQRAALPNEKAIPYFIEVVKDFIKFENGKPFGFYCEFNNDYTKIRKLKSLLPLVETTTNQHA